MCGGVVFQYRGEIITQFFPRPGAQLPVLLGNGETMLIPWGRREDEIHPLEKPFPATGWAQRETLKNSNSLWYKLPHQRVKIPVMAFMEKSLSGEALWFSLAEGEYISGWLLSTSKIRKVYVITQAPPEDAMGRWIKPPAFQQSLLPELETIPQLHDRFPWVLARG